MNKQTIMVVGDDVRMSSGVGNQLRFVVKKLVREGYDVVNIGVINNGNKDEMSAPQKHVFDGGEEIIVYNTSQYDNLYLWEHIIKNHNVSGIIFMTDPYRYQRYWQYAYSIRSRIPTYYVSVWDSFLAPHDEGKYHWNLPYYESVDHIGVISKQTEWYTNRVFDKSFFGKRPPVEYVAHGSDPSIFKPLPPQDLELVKEKLFRGNKYDFVVMLNSRNQGRKKIGDLIEAFRLFNDEIGKEASSKTALLLHTDAVSDFGTNLIEVCSALAPRCNIYINNERCAEYVLNMLYNTADVCVNISNAEGFGLSCNEAMLAGTPVIANATGGLVDQIGFFKDGLTPKWSLDFKKELPYLGHGIWAKPVFPSRTITGNPSTPYLYDENANIDDVKDALLYWYNIAPYERERMGAKGRDYAISMGMTGPDFANNVVDGVQRMMKNFTPFDLYTVYKV
jgi:glycosyltransferase involved in cell wall biosynthesis